MILLSYNVRGLGSNVKLRAIRELVHQEKVGMLLVHESKLEEVDIRVCRSLWGSDDCEWLFKASDNRAGGIICIWQRGKFQLHNSLVGDGFVALLGYWENQPSICGIINVYAPCNSVGKQKLWDDLEELINNTGISCFCIAGDFNVVSSPAERIGAVNNDMYEHRETIDFNSFISNLQLIEPPLAGKKFTWHRANGQAASRLDRFLLSSDWCSCCPNSNQVVLNRSFFDHCPVLYRGVNVNWGLKPFKVLNCWFSDHRFKDFVTREWASFLLRVLEVMY
ncbi:uncharacterized protein LOC130736749 [Lotus japonicus]|uniref:uncharacterized protein LOC130736749 n=1 Tax=Lotus japonicus TaxID=34305 RepID=UPI0025897FFA|nr:uncharacterized protein LOC130736749 [Lotus japonicus]